ncbi:MAG TPA: helix-turn-helix domain-containing protein [Thermoanaerobaculia bacterium]|nr:helix-turn-helix domain-containing protein [Thermoanaerobaculia bacterium]
MAYDPESPPPGKILTLLRWLQNWPQKDLAAAVGCGSPLLSDYEAGRKPLSRSRLEEIAARMGVLPEGIDEVADFWKSFRFQRRLGSGDAKARRNAFIERFTRTSEAYALAVLAMSDAEWAEEARREARSLWERLVQHPPAKQRVLVEGARRYQSWALSELVCQKSLEAAADRADRALALAELAVRIAELSPGEFEWCQRVQGYAWAHLGNARRVAGDLPSAEEAFGRARVLWEAGESIDIKILNKALILGLEASLRMEQRRFSQALVLLDRALSEHHEETLRKQLLLNRANVLELAGDFEGAISTLKELEPLLSEDSEPRLVCVMRFSLANSFLQVGNPEKAEALLPSLGELTAGLGNELDGLRTRWLEGRIKAALGQRKEAIFILSQVREDLLLRGMAYDTALALLEIAVLYLEAGHTSEVKVLARQMASLFKAQDVHREALAALRIFREAAEREAVTVEMARDLVSYLNRARHDPTLRFENLPAST